MATLRWRPARQWTSTRPSCSMTGSAALTPVRKCCMGMGVSGLSIERRRTRRWECATSLGSGVNVMLRIRSKRISGERLGVTRMRPCADVELLGDLGDVQGHELATPARLPRVPRSSIRSCSPRGPESRTRSQPSAPPTRSQPADPMPRRAPRARLRRARRDRGRARGTARCLAHARRLPRIRRERVPRR